MTLEELTVKITAKTDQLERELKETRQEVQKFATDVNKSTQKVESGFQNLAKAIPWAAIVAGLVKISKAAIQASSDLQEVQNVVDVSFGESADKIDSWAKSMKEGFGLSETSAKKFASTFKTMGDSMQLDDSTSGAIATNLTQLAADMASFYNTDAETAATAIKAIYTGETETLKKFGIVLTETNLNEYALANGIKENYSQMSQAEKVLLRYSYVMEVTNKAQGDFQRTINSTANQIKLLKENGVQLAQQFGDVINPTVQDILSATNELAPAMQDLISTLGDVVESAQPLIDTVVLLTKSNLTTIIGTITSALKIMTPVVSELAKVLDPIVEFINGLLMLPVGLVNAILEEFIQYADLSREIEFSVQNTVAGYKELDTFTQIAANNAEAQEDATKRMLFLLAGFDELNILKKQDTPIEVINEESVTNLKTTDDLMSQLVDWQDKANKAQSQINDLYQQGADKLGVTREQFRRIYDAYIAEDWTTYYTLLGEFEIDTKEADRVMEAFKEQCGAILSGLQQDLNTALQNVETLTSKLRELGETVPDYTPKQERPGGTYTPPEPTGFKKFFKEVGDWLLGLENAFNNLDWYKGSWEAPSASALATGGVLTAPTIGLLGEYAGASSNPEIVTPQNIMRQTMEEANLELANVIAQAAQQMITAINNQNLEVRIGDDVIANSASRGNKAYYRRTGEYLI